MVIAMRIGTTSYIYPADILTNVHQLAGKGQDVELVVFECAETGDDLPDEEMVEHLRVFGAAHDITYTVHLPLDLRLADDDPSLERAVRVIRCTEALSPLGYVVHLDGETPTDRLDLAQWLENSLRSLDALDKAGCDQELICVENLDDQPPPMLDAILERVPVSCCVDLGHLWKQGVEPLPHLDRWLCRARVIHLHGIGVRDHSSLSLVPPANLDPVMELLFRHFNGVVTLEVFNEADLENSLRALRESAVRVGASPDTNAF